HVGVRIAQVDPEFHAPEQVRRQDHVALLGVVLGDFAHISIDAENLLTQHDARTLAARRHSQIATELAAIGGGDVDPLSSHDWVFLLIECVADAVRAAMHSYMCIPSRQWFRAGVHTSPAKARPERLSSRAPA